MKRALLLSLLFSATGSFAADTSVEWDYAAPEKWSELSEKFTQCKGHNQSPVNIETATLIDANLEPIELDYSKTEVKIVKTPHTLKVSYPENHGNKIDLEEKAKHLKQYHFHAPSEYTFDGKQYPLSAHFVHANDEGQLTVIGVLFEEGEENPQLQAIIDKTESEDMTVVFDAGALLPNDKSYYRLNGSLTTPPCSEGVRWVIMKETVKASKAQIDAIASHMPENNARPVQQINARTVLH